LLRAVVSTTTTIITATTFFGGKLAVPDMLTPVEAMTWPPFDWAWPQVAVAVAFRSIYKLIF